MKLRNSFSLFALIAFLLCSSCASKLDDKPAENPPHSQVNQINFLDKKICVKTKERVDERYIIRKKDKSGFIDGCGRIVVEPQYDSVLEFSEGFARVKNGGKYEYIDKTGNVVLTAGGAGGGFFREGFFRTKYIGDWGERWIYGTENNLAIFNSVCIKGYSFFDGYALIHDGKHVKIITDSNKSIAIFSGENVGFYDTSLSYLRYSEPSIFHPSEQAYYSDYAGQKLFDDDFLDRRPFCKNKGFFFNRPQHTIRLFDKHNKTLCFAPLAEGEIAVTPVCDPSTQEKFHAPLQKELNVPWHVPHYLPVRSESWKWGLFDLQCKRIFPTVYDFIKTLPDHRFIARKNKKWNLYNKNGKPLFSETYKILKVCPSGQTIRKISSDTPMILFDDKGQQILSVKTGTISCPLKGKVIVKDRIQEYLYDIFQHKRLKSFQLTQKYHRIHFFFLDGKIIMREKGWLIVYDADFQNILLKVKDGVIRVFNTFGGTIRILTIGEHTYYLTRQYKVFWRNVKE